MDGKGKSLILAIYMLITSYFIDKLLYFSISSVEEMVYFGQGVGKFNHYQRIKYNVKLIFYGNSRSNHHLNPSFFTENAFNMGVNGTGLAYSCAMVQLLPEKIPQTILVHLDPEELFNPEYNGTDLQPLVYLYHKNSKIKAELQKSSIFNPLQHIYWCIGYNAKLPSILYNFFHSSSGYKYYNGFDPILLDKNQGIVRNRIFDRVNDETCADCLIGLKVNLIALSYIKSIIQFAAANQKRLIFFSSPLYYDSCKNDNVALTSMMNSLHADYWDFSDLFREKQQRELWMDKEHLSAEGANRFSQHVALKYSLKDCF